MSSSLAVTCAVEGPVDEAVLRRLAWTMGAELGPVHGRRGKNHLDQRIEGYNSAARYYPWLVLRDLDHDEHCAVSLRNRLLPSPETQMCFRIAVRSVEAWLLADRSNIASFLGVSTDLIPKDPELVDNPKNAVAALAQRSRRRPIREDMAPKPGSGRSVGPAYPARLIEFARQHWHPEVALRASDSLYRTIRCWRRILGLS